MEMKKYFLIILLMLVGVVSEGALVKATNPNPPGAVLINEILPGTATSSSQEFIELYNPADSPVNLTGWTLQYASLSGNTWKSLPKLTLVHTTIVAKGFYLAATPDYLTDKADATFSATLAQGGGQLRLVDASSTPQDIVSWGSGATMALGSPATAPQPGQSLSRKLVAGVPVMTYDNSADFGLADQPTPGAANVSEPQPPPEPVAPGDPGITYPDIFITELLPNPAPPQTDGNDEFVELYNPGTSAVDLTGYTLVTGSSDSYKFKLANISIDPNSYRVFTSHDTNLVLSNSGGRAKLLAPDGTTIDQTSTYATAPDGQAWAADGDQWVWTTTPTPAAANIITNPESPIDPQPPPVGSADIEISELLPNPAAPQTDAADEFVELYNPGNIDVDLTGYVIVTGNNGSYKYKISGVVVPAGGYQVFYSRDTSLSLSNSGGKAQLLAPDGTVIYQTDPYSDAPPGESWILNKGLWAWTSTSTPGQANVFSAPPAPVPKAKEASTKASSAKPASAKKTSSASVKTAVAKKPSAKTATKAKAKAKSSKKATIGAASVKPNGGSGDGSNGLHTLVLAGVGGLAVVYGLYEYRHDLANQFYRFQRYREARRAAGGAT